MRCEREIITIRTRDYEEFTPERSDLTDGHSETGPEVNMNFANLSMVHIAVERRVHLSSSSGPVLSLASR